MNDSDYIKEVTTGYLLTAVVHVKHTINSNIIEIINNKYANIKIIFVASTQVIYENLIDITKKTPFIVILEKMMINKFIKQLIDGDHVLFMTDDETCDLTLLDNAAFNLLSEIIYPLNRYTTDGEDYYFNFINHKLDGNIESEKVLLNIPELTQFQNQDDDHDIHPYAVVIEDEFKEKELENSETPAHSLYKRLFYFTGILWPIKDFRYCRIVEEEFNIRNLVNQLIILNNFNLSNNLSNIKFFSHEKFYILPSQITTQLNYLVSLDHLMNTTTDDQDNMFLKTEADEILLDII